MQDKRTVSVQACLIMQPLTDLTQTNAQPLHVSRFIRACPATRSCPAKSYLPSLPEALGRAWNPALFHLLYLCCTLQRSVCPAACFEHNGAKCTCPCDANPRSLPPHPLARVLFSSPLLRNFPSSGSSLIGLYWPTTETANLRDSSSPFCPIPES